MKNLFLSALGSILAVIFIEIVLRTEAAARLFGSSYALAARLRKAGILAFQVSREDYGSGLCAYLENALHSISIVSVSLKVTNDEGDLLSFFRRKLAQNESLRVRISLLAPHSAASAMAAISLNQTAHNLDTEIITMLHEMMRARSLLPLDQQKRWEILVHEFLPMGSAIMLDVLPNAGRIQIETKLYRTPRVESFRFEIVGPGPFYEHQCRGWTRVLDDSRPPAESELEQLQTQV
jgi:hypothetical protein